MVEPAVYDPYTHGRIFEEVLNHIINPEITEIDDVGRGPRRPEEFDLLIFPEAFAPAPSLLVVLDAISRLQELGCVHVGLRPSAAKKHLFSVPQIEELVTSLKSVPRSVAEDLEAFESWLAVQDPSHRFNLGCLFAIDREHRLRICLHPKMVRSNLEHSAIPDEHMDQGNLVTLVTLLPSDRTMLSQTIQPLICSDALDLRTDGKTPPPIAAVNRKESAFDPTPDHRCWLSCSAAKPETNLFHLTQTGRLSACSSDASGVRGASGTGEIAPPLLLAFDFCQSPDGLRPWARPSGFRHYRQA